MGWKILLLCFIPFLGYQTNDLSRFLNSVDRKIIYVRSFRSAIERVKCEPLTECPGIIVAVFSFKGKRLVLNACTPNDITEHEQFPVCETCTVCFLVNKKIYVYKGASKKN
jgi:hypothetical protein